MENLYYTLSQILLPDEVSHYFTITDIKNAGNTVEIYLEENDEYLTPEDGHEYDKNGFYEPMNIQDFPLRGRKTILKVKRRRWIDRNTGKSVGNNYKLVAEGTRHSKEFAAFLKEFIGYIPDYGPLA